MSTNRFLGVPVSDLRVTRHNYTFTDGGTCVDVRFTSGPSRVSVRVYLRPSGEIEFVAVPRTLRRGRSQMVYGFKRAQQLSAVARTVLSAP